MINAKHPINPLRSTRWYAVCLCTLFSFSAFAEETKGDSPAKSKGIVRPEGHVLTYYGLRKLEHDPEVSEEEKLKEWEAYLVRARANILYAKKAIDRWKTAARQRVLENVRRDDRDEALQPGEKITRWKRIIKLYPKSRESRLAQKRISFWKSAETKLLVEAAENVERKRGNKVERIQAWKKVVEWTKAGPEGKAARKRIKALQDQLYSEAQSLDRITRVDAKTKLASWQDVLAGAPTSAQRRKAKKRIAVLKKSEK
jgi:hypothetical protein